MKESFSDLMKIEEKNNSVISCTVLRKFTRGKNEFFKVDAGMKTEGIVNAKEFEIQPLPGEKVNLIILESHAHELVMSFEKVKLQQVLEKINNFQKSKDKTIVFVKEKIPIGYKVSYDGVFGILNTSSTNLQENVEVFITKVFKNSFYCVLETKKNAKSNLIKNTVVDCIIEKKDDFFAFVKINNQEKLEGVIDVREVKSDKEIKAQIIYIEGIKAVLSTTPLKKLEIKKTLLKLDIEHDNSLKVKGKIEEINKEGAYILIGNICCFVPIKDLFWTNAENDPKIDINFYKKGEIYNFYIKDMITYWKSEIQKISLEVQYEISNLINSSNNIFKGEFIDKNTLKVGSVNFNVNILENIPFMNKEYDFSLESIVFKLNSCVPNLYINFNKKYSEGSLVKGKVITNPMNKKEIFLDVEGVSCQLSIFEIDWDFSIARKKFYSLKIGDEIQARVKYVNSDKPIVQLTLKLPRGDEFYSAVRSLQKGKTYHCKVEEIILNQFKKIKKLKITISDDQKYQNIFGFILKMDLSNQKRIEVGDIIDAKFVKIYNQELLFSQKAVEQDENTRVAKMIEKINEGEGDAFSSLEEHFNFF